VIQTPRDLDLEALLVTLDHLKRIPPRRPVRLTLISLSPRFKARLLRVWNGMFAAGDWRAQRGLKTISPRRDRKSETTTREKWPQKWLFC